jgi:8-oxo-dGTP diphosphatase
MKKQPRVTVDAVLEGEEGILLVQRKKEPFQGRWAFPGGFVEYGETTEEAVRREVKEETGITFEIQGLLGVYSDPLRDPRGHVISICYYGRGSGKAKGDGDAAAARFFPLQAALEEPLAFDHHRILRDYLEVQGVL